MKKLLGSLLAFFMVCSFANAQEQSEKGKGRGKKHQGFEKVKGAKKRVEAAFEKVGLSAEQQTKAKESMKSTAIKIKEVKQSGISKDEMRSKVKDLRKAEAKSLSEIMGQDKFEAFKKEMKASKPNHAGGTKGKAMDKDDDDDMEG